MGACLLMSSNVAVAQRAEPMTLSALDYNEIRQLVDRYNWALDTCADNGYEYARLFTPDGTFGRAKGHDQLAALSGGGSAGCKDPKRVHGVENELHITMNLIIEPSPEGATGKSYLLRVWPTKPPEFTAWFHDVYVKTPEGWRFKSRREVRSPALNFGRGSGERSEQRR
jgi:hypothetical protein